MDTVCRIEWLDNGSQEDVVIRSTEFNNDVDDENIFYYGLDRSECIRHQQTMIPVDDFRIIEVY